MHGSRLGALSLVVVLAACGSKESAAPDATSASQRQPAVAAVDAARLAAADAEPGNWMSYGRTYANSASAR